MLLLHCVSAVDSPVQRPLPMYPCSRIRESQKTPTILLPRWQKLHGKPTLLLLKWMFSQSIAEMKVEKAVKKKRKRFCNLKSFSAYVYFAACISWSCVDWNLSQFSKDEGNDGVSHFFPYLTLYCLTQGSSYMTLTRLASLQCQYGITPTPRTNLLSAKAEVRKAKKLSAFCQQVYVTLTVCFFCHT